MVNSICALYGAQEQSINHHLLQYEYLQLFQRCLLRKLWIQALPNNLHSLWHEWRINFPDKGIRTAIYAIILIGIWNIWKERNGRIFRYEAYLFVEVSKKTKFLYQDWTSAETSGPFTNISDTIYNEMQKEDIFLCHFHIR